MPTAAQTLSDSVLSRKQQVLACKTQRTKNKCQTSASIEIVCDNVQASATSTMARAQAHKLALTHRSPAFYICLEATFIPSHALPPMPVQEKAPKENQWPFSETAPCKEKHGLAQRHTHTHTNASAKTSLKLMPCITVFGRKAHTFYFSTMIRNRFFLHCIFTTEPGHKKQKRVAKTCFSFCRGQQRWRPCPFLPCRNVRFLLAFRANMHTHKGGSSPSFFFLRKQGPTREYFVETALACLFFVFTPRVRTCHQPARLVTRNIQFAARRIRPHAPACAHTHTLVRTHTGGPKNTWAKTAWTRAGKLRRM